MGCGSSKKTPRVQAPTLNKKTTLPAIEPQSKKKTPSAKSNGSTDSGIEDSEPIKKPPVSSKIPLPVDSLLIEHHQKSRLGKGETFDIITAPKPGALAPLRHVPRFLAEKKPEPVNESDLQAKLAAKQERASRKRQEIEEARRLASSRIGHRATTKPATTTDSFPKTTSYNERHQQLSMLRDQLRQGSNNNLQDPMHTPRTPRADSSMSGTSDAANLTPRRGGFVIGATTASRFKPVYD